MRKLPAEIVASTLAVTTLFIPAHLPPWAIFITWAGTFAVGGPKPEVLRKIWPTAALGAWLRWGFGAFGQGGFWRRRPPRPVMPMPMPMPMHGGPWPPNHGGPPPPMPGGPPPPPMPPT